MQKQKNYIVRKLKKCSTFEDLKLDMKPDKPTSKKNTKVHCNDNFPAKSRKKKLSESSLAEGIISVCRVVQA